MDLHVGEGFMLVAVDELLVIGEFSRRFGRSPKVLRTYADSGVLTPTAIDPSSGYRYYSPVTTPWRSASTSRRWLRSTATVDASSAIRRA
jgi:hypothetical protein